jgi:hypothetical protein
MANQTNQTNKKKKVSVKKTYEVCDELKTLAEKVITTENMDLEGAKVQYLLVYPYISKRVAGRCIKNNGELNFYSGSDYLVEMSGELWDKLDDTVKYVLTQHELMHILVVTKENGDTQFNLRDHDIQDFQTIVKKHGVDWIQKVKLSMSSLYDMEPADEDKIKI